MPITDPDWIPPIEATFDPEKPIRSEQGVAIAGNPIAMALGKPGSPVILFNWHPYDMTEAGTGDGEIWSFSADGAVSAIETPDFAEGWEYRLELIDVANSAGTADLTLAVYYQTSAVYSGEGLIRSFPPSPTGQKTSGYAAFNRAFEASSTHAVDYAAGGLSVTGVGVALSSAFSGVLFYTHSTPQRIGKARISINLGTMNGGKVLLMRRKLYG